MKFTKITMCVFMLCVLLGSAIMVAAETVQKTETDTLIINSINNPNAPKADPDSKGLERISQYAERDAARSWWQKFLQSFAFVPSMSCNVGAEYRSSFKSACNGGTFEPIFGSCTGTQTASFGASCSAGQRVKLLACPCTNQQSCACTQVFSDQWLKTTSSDNLNVLTSCGGSCYYQSWFNQAINGKYIGYDCLNCGDVITPVCSLLNPSACPQTGAMCIDSQNYCASSFLYQGYYYCNTDEILCTNGCANNVCTQPSCSSGQTKCLTPTTQSTCTSAGQWETSQACSYGCSNTKCNVCTPNAKECTGTVSYRQCKADGSGWTALSCSSGQACSNNNCVMSCTAGTRRCTTGTQGYETCNSAGTGWTASSCTGTDQCSSGMCLPTVSCQPNVKECSGTNTYKQCNPTGNAWSSPITCPTGQLCTGSGVCSLNIICSPLARECTDSTNYRTCNSDGTVWTPSPCPTGLNCNNGNCAAPPQCTSSATCSDNNNCTTDTCESNVCKYTNIPGCGTPPPVTCKAYEGKQADGLCKFSFSALFTSAGFSAYWDEKPEIVVGIGVLLIFVIVIIILLFKKGNSGGQQGLW